MIIRPNEEYEEYENLKRYFASHAVDVSFFKQYLKPYINSTRQWTRLTEWREVFHVLEVRNYLDSKNVKLLLKLAKDMKNQTLIDGIKSYDKLYGEDTNCVCGCERTTCEPIQIEDNDNTGTVTDSALAELLKNVAQQIGGEWKVLARELGVKERVIDEITRSNCSSHADCALMALFHWMEHGDASRSALLTALNSRHCKRKGIGEHLLQKLQYVIIEM